MYPYNTSILKHTDWHRYNNKNASQLLHLATVSNLHHTVCPHWQIHLGKNHFVCLIHLWQSFADIYPHTQHWLYPGGYGCHVISCRFIENPIGLTTDISLLNVIGKYDLLISVLKLQFEICLVFSPVWDKMVVCGLNNYLCNKGSMSCFE